MVDGSAVSPTASLMELLVQLHGGYCVDSFKAVVLGLPQWWEDVLREIYQSWRGVGITLGSKLVLEGCVGSPWTVGWSWKDVSTLEGILLRWAQPSAGVHQAQRVSRPSQSWEDVSVETLRPGRVGIPWSGLFSMSMNNCWGTAGLGVGLNTKV